MAAIGHEVVGVDFDEGKVSVLNSGKAWFYEPGLDEMLTQNIEADRLRFTTSFAEAAAFAEVHFLCVATPGKTDGSYDLSQLHAVMSSLVPLLLRDSVIIGKSTVAPGTAVTLQAMADSMRLDGDGSRVQLVWNPEFLREGFAVEDTLRPDRIVVGVASADAAAAVREVYRPITDAGIPLVVTDLATSELVKGAANAFLATKISFINAMADICAATKGDISALARALGMDPRIGPACLTAGLGYGGACLPKDVRGLAAFARSAGADGAEKLLNAVDVINVSRGDQVVKLVQEAVGALEGKRVAVWGAAFKPGTDDVRGSVGLRVADQLHTLGGEVTVYDPMACGTALLDFPELTYADSALAAARDADVVVVVTAWPEFAQAHPLEVAAAVARKTVVDACQGIHLTTWVAEGWQVFSLTGCPSGQIPDGMPAPDDATI